MNKKQVRGDFGEVAVCEYLARKGYRIVAKNYRKPFGEIDIIASKKNEVVFTEVKTRKFGSMTEGVEAVTYKKRLAIVKTARAFVRENMEFGDMNARFDVAQVIVTTDEIPRLLELDYYEDAFNPALL